MALTQVSTNGIKDLNVNTDDIANNAVTMAKLDNTGGITLPANIGVVAANMYPNAVTTNIIANEAVTLAKLEHGTSSNDGKFLRANNGADPSFETVSLPDADRIIEGNSYAEVLDTGSNGIFRFLPEGTEKFRIATNGHVGIGTTNPIHNLVITDTHANEPQIRLETSDGGNKRLDLFVDNQSQATISAQQSAQNIAINARNQTIFSQGGAGSESESMRINASGYVGVGEANPGRLVTIKKDSTATYNSTGFSGENNSILRIHNSNGTDNTGVNNHTGLEFVVASGANSYGQFGLVRTGNNVGDFFFKTRTGGNSYAEQARIKNDGTIQATKFKYASHPGHTAFTGNGSGTTISIQAGHNVNSVLVVYNGLVLTPTTDYTISGTTLTLQFTPPTNAQVIVRYLIQ